MGLSVQEFTFDGDYDFDLSFALGYDKQSDITVEVDTGGTFAVAAQFDFLSENQIRITSPTDLEIGDTVRALRTVSKTNPSVDVTQPAKLTRDSVQKLFLQSMHTMHEVLDGRITAAVDIDSEVLSVVTGAVASAITQSGIVASYKFPVQLDGAMTGPIQAMNGDNLFLEAVQINIETNPSSAVEVLISDINQVIYSFTVGTDGTVTETYAVAAPNSIAEGLLTMSIVGDDYATGMVVQVSVIGSATEFLDFATEFPDFLSIYEASKTA